MKPRYAQNRICIRGYITEEAEHALRVRARLKGRSLSQHIRHLVSKDLEEANRDSKVVQLNLI